MDIVNQLLCAPRHVCVLWVVTLASTALCARTRQVFLSARPFQLPRYGIHGVLHEVARVACALHQDWLLLRTHALEQVELQCVGVRIPLHKGLRLCPSTAPKDSVGGSCVRKAAREGFCLVCCNTSCRGASRTNRARRVISARRTSEASLTFRAWTLLAIATQSWPKVRAIGRLAMICPARAVRVPALALDTRRIALRCWDPLPIASAAVVQLLSFRHDENRSRNASIRTSPLGAADAQRGVEEERLVSRDVDQAAAKWKRLR
mmetsp:Transcript_40702/g.102241  ORF Transcript_40702/g.102241 Transcript_40702/m.102241 type:complete len:263 (-) Transcript_40702:156-944(-)